jgi:DNA polymerase V
MGRYRAITGAEPVVTPLFQDKVAAGFPSPAQDYIEKTIDLNDYCIRHPAATYFVIATGNSMVEAGICHGSLLVVDRSLQAKHGDIVIAAVSGEYTVKRLCTSPQIQLLAMNPDYPPILFADENAELEVFGVVTFCINGLR